MKYLRPKFLVSMFGLRNVEIEKFNIRTVYKLFKEGKYSNVNNEYYLDLSDDIYSKIPKPIRYFLSEDLISRKTFMLECFYPYDTDENQIIIDYGYEVLSRYPKHKKTMKIMKEMKRDFPELFV